MARRGFTLVEILVAVVILGIVTGMTMTVFQYQNRNWKTESDKAEVAMMTKGVIDEMTSMIRMTGGGLMDNTVGLKVWGGGEERITFVLNSTNWVDTSHGFVYDPASRRLRIAIDSAAKFNPNGFVHVQLTLPAAGSSMPTPASVTRLVPFVLPVLDRVGGCGQDSLVVDASTLYDPPNSWTWKEAVAVLASQLVYSLDSVSYRKSHDTLWVRWNRLPESVFALGVDTLRIMYWHPVTGWLDSLSGAAPINRIEKVRIRLVMRSRTLDKKLLSQRPATRGYRFSVLETEVALRNENLINK